MAISIRIVVLAAAGIGLAASACTRPNAPAQQNNSVDVEPANPDHASPFDNAVNFECEGGGRVDMVFPHTPETVIARIDGAEPVSLAMDEASTTGMAYKDESTTIIFEGDGITLSSSGLAKQCRFVSRPLPPPKAAGVVRNLSESDAGAVVEIKVGEKISVSLSGVPTAGYLWAAPSPPSFVRVADGPGGATTTAQFVPGFAGGNHWEVLVIEAVAAGDSEITLVQKRPWENAASVDDRTFKFRLKAS
jgi:predicted secreted protein